MSKAKYRPSLTAAMIDHLINLAKLDVVSATPHNKQLSMAALGVLAPFQAKIQNAGLTPAYTVTEVPRTLAASIGMEPSGNNQAELKSKEEVWEDAYNKYKLNPALCTLQEIADAKEHMYVNDLMSPAEAAAFERGEL